MKDTIHSVTPFIVTKLFATATLKSVASTKLLPFLSDIPPFSLGSTFFYFNWRGSYLGQLSVFLKRYRFHVVIVNLSIPVDSVGLIHIGFKLKPLTKDTSCSMLTRDSTNDPGHIVIIMCV